jgi:excinuclease UvrABC nuclease subunit
LPGVYSFWDAADHILYVGKAKNLKHRLTSYTYFDKLAPKIKKLVTTAREVRFEILNSELEAILTEAELINTHQPQYNTLLKDDKSPLYLCITDEEFPKVLRLRKTDLRHSSQAGTILGPFSSGFALQEVLKLARKIFPWCNQGPPKPGKPPKACFYHHLDLCPGVCVSAISAPEYQASMKALTLFLRGKKRSVVTELKAQLKAFVRAENFEQANVIKYQLEAIEKVTSEQYRLGPELVLPNFNQAETEAGLVFLQKLLSDYLSVPHGYPLHRIEGYDVSNTQGKQAAVSQVVLTDGVPDPTEYRLFNIRGLDTPNDYQMLKEALTRRQLHEEWGEPNLVVVDGGKGQVRAALSVWQWPTKVIGIAKDPDRLVFPQKTGNTLSYQVITLPTGHPALKLVQQLRDEAHRFARKQHRKLAIKKLLRDTSEVEL